MYCDQRSHYIRPNSKKNIIRGNYFLKYGKGPSINDVSSEGEGGGSPSKPIYYISLFSNLSRQGEGGGVINSEKWSDIVYG